MFLIETQNCPLKENRRTIIPFDSKTSVTRHHLDNLNRDYNIGKKIYLGDGNILASHHRFKSVEYFIIRTTIQQYSIDVPRNTMPTEDHSMVLKVITSSR
ncbi:hypothetical protein CEXT_788711 [Caerostris extrusa]|uniref:Uncharacterized protein n=1 Tax=Caerostris extrusa TaxID=172846 RepID=A0AAV4XJE3_CAEEX|nr:hypothetical protein CEXT_788711 [Caerostris extrusa]